MEENQQETTNEQYQQGIPQDEHMYHQPYEYQSKEVVNLQKPVSGQNTGYENVYQSDQNTGYENVYQSGQNADYESIYQTGGSGQYTAYNPYTQYQHPNQKPGNGFGIASLIMGIVSLILFCTCINIPLGIVAIIFGIIHLTKDTDNKVLGIVGIVTSVISILAFVMGLVVMWRPLLTYYENLEGDFSGSGYEFNIEDGDFDYPFGNPFEHENDDRFNDDFDEDFFY